MTFALRHRQTSRQSDETICITNMLGKDSAELLSTPPERRMQLFLNSLQNIPPALLFMGEPRLTERGFCWAPSSLLRRRDRCYEVQRLVVLPRHSFPDRPGVRIYPNGKGLIITSPGVSLPRISDLPQHRQLLSIYPRRRCSFSLQDMTEILLWNVCSGSR